MAMKYRYDYLGRGAIKPPKPWRPLERGKRLWTWVKTPDKSLWWNTLYEFWDRQLLPREGARGCSKQLPRPNRYVFVWKTREVIDRFSKFR